MPFSSLRAHRQVLPVDQIGADRMPPTHVPPFRPEGIVLIEKVVFAFVVNQTVRIVGPVLRRSEMIQKPERTIESSLWSTIRGMRENGCNDNHQQSLHALRLCRPMASSTVHEGVAPGRLATRAPTLFANSAIAARVQPFEQPCRSAAEKASPDPTVSETSITNPGDSMYSPFCQSAQPAAPLVTQAVVSLVFDAKASQKLRMLPTGKLNNALKI